MVLLDSVRVECSSIMDAPVRQALALHLHHLADLGSFSWTAMGGLRAQWKRFRWRCVGSTDPAFVVTSYYYYDEKPTASEHSQRGQLSASSRISYQLLS